jgi:uncharacterized membrane protein
MIPNKSLFFSFSIIFFFALISFSLIHTTFHSDRRILKTTGGGRSGGTSGRSSGRSSGGTSVGSRGGYRGGSYRSGRVGGVSTYGIFSRSKYYKDNFSSVLAPLP